MYFLFFASFIFFFWYSFLSMNFIYFTKWISIDVVTLIVAKVHKTIKNRCLKFSHTNAIKFDTKCEIKKRTKQNKITLNFQLVVQVLYTYITECLLQYYIIVNFFFPFVKPFQFLFCCVATWQFSLFQYHTFFIWNKNFVFYFYFTKSHFIFFGMDSVISFYTFFFILFTYKIESDFNSFFFFIKPYSCMSAISPWISCAIFVLHNRDNMRVYHFECRTQLFLYISI